MFCKKNFPIFAARFEPHSRVIAKSAVLIGNQKFNLLGCGYLERKRVQYNNNFRNGRKRKHHQRGSRRGSSCR